MLQTKLETYTRRILVIGSVLVQPVHLKGPYPRPAWKLSRLALAVAQKAARLS